jgi:hypothetical protein
LVYLLTTLLLQVVVAVVVVGVLTVVDQELAQVVIAPFQPH